MSLPPAREVAIQISRLNHFFGKGDAQKQALYDNHLTVHRGEIVIMTGPSGSGKTTLLTLIGALRSVQEGSITLAGTELSGLNPAQQVEMRRNLGFIFQAHNLLDGLTARQNVRMAIELTATPRGDYDRAADAMLAAVGLSDRVTYKPRNLSGGQRQRVAIARALVNKPRFILADEPTAALDKDSGANVVRLLRELASNHGTTVLIVTHDSRIISVADRIVNMVDGHIVSDLRIKETMVICAILKKCSVFKDMSPSDLTDIAQKMIEERFDAGSDIIRLGDVGDKFYVVASGSTDIIIETATGTRAVAKLGEGDFFGEVALLKDQPRNATVTTREPTVVYALSKENFLAAVKSHKSFEEQMANILFSRG
ncbi:MAG: ATP-binding cassette domain-containing protein [Opitutaceae bacterium]|nr:ATP-binding cassette domain-containing protein [Opitutaceae bacterium]